VTLLREHELWYRKKRKSGEYREPPLCLNYRWVKSTFRKMDLQGSRFARVLNRSLSKKHFSTNFSQFHKGNAHNKVPLKFFFKHISHHAPSLYSLDVHIFSFLVEISPQHWTLNVKLALFRSRHNDRYSNYKYSFIQTQFLGPTLNTKEIFI
jgi:hypothetical protein